MQKPIFTNQSVKAYRRQLRNNMTPAEVALWSMINKKQLNGERFLRQYSIGSYIVDFYCPKHKLAIELDGQVHYDSEEAIERDARRTKFIESFGVKILRFENFEVFDYPQRTLDEIEKWLME